MSTGKESTSLAFYAQRIPQLSMSQYHHYSVVYYLQKKTEQGSEQRARVPLQARQLMEAVCGYHSWGSLALPRLPRPGSGTVAGSQSSEEFVLGLDQVLQNTRSPHRLVLPLLVAHVESAATYLQRTKASFFAGGPNRAKGAVAPSPASARDVWMCCFGATSDDARPEEEEEENADFVAACHWFGLALKVCEKVFSLLGA